MTGQRVHEYVTYGGLATSAGPFSCRGTTLHGFLLEGDGDCIRGLCEKVFAAPSGDRIRVQPFGHHVMLTFGIVRRLSSMTFPFSQMGDATEKQVGLWIPVTVSQRTTNGPAQSWLAWFVPYMWVDNPLSLSGGREVYGYAKNWGWINGPEVQRPMRLLLSVYGGNFRAGAPAGKHSLITVRATQRRGSTDTQREWHDFGRALAQHTGEVGAEATKIIREGANVSERLVGALMRGHGPRQIFLKQFRSPSDGDRASSQQIVEAAAKIKRLTPTPRLEEFYVDVRHLDSHPLARDLGIGSQPTRLAFRVNMDFVLEAGRVLWDAHVASLPQVAPTGDLERLVSGLAVGLRSVPGMSRLIASAEALLRVGAGLLAPPPAEVRPEPTRELRGVVTRRPLTRTGPRGTVGTGRRRV